MLFAWHKSLGYKLNLYSNVARFFIYLLAAVCDDTLCPAGSTGGLYDLPLARALPHPKRRKSSLSWSSLEHCMCAFGYVSLCLWSSCTLTDPGPRQVVVLSLSFTHSYGALFIFLDLAIVQVTVRSFLSRFDRLSVSFTHQGIYPLTIVLLVTMHLSAAEVIHRTDPEVSESPISIGFASPELSSTIRNIGGFLESSGDVVSHEGRSTGSLVYDRSEKR